MSVLQTIDEHLYIRETVGYDLIKEVPLEDMPTVINFLKIVFNYNKMKEKLKDEGEGGLILSSPKVSRANCPTFHLPDHMG
jgi:hypothetical protein